MVRCFVILLVLSLLTGTGYSQVSASATAAASIVEPLNIPKALDLSIGPVAVIVAGTVVMTPTDAQNVQGQIALPVSTGTFTAAIFYISGSTSGYTYTITVPPSPHTIKSGKGSMKVDSFESDPTLRGDTGLIAGIHVMVTPLNVTVNYN